MTLSRKILVGCILLAGAAVPAMAHGARVGIGIGIGVPLWGPGYYAPAYAYPPAYYYPYPPTYYAPPSYYGPPPVAYQPAPAPTPPSDPPYRYYCPDNKGYWPTVPECPSSWLRVVPN